MSEYKYIHTDFKDKIALVTIDRPPVNAWNIEVQNEFDSTLQEIEKRDDIVTVVITSKAERIFIAGADLTAVVNMGPDQAYEFSQSTQTILNKIRNLKQIVIVAINGLALGGGCEVAMACDIRVADIGSSIGLPEVSLGLIPGAGGTQRLSRLIGTGKAIELIATGDLITAMEAHQIGMVERVVPKGQALAEAMRIAKKIVLKGPIAVASAKKAIYRGAETNIENGMKIESQLFSQLFNTQDFIEGTKAFLEKRTPSFIGK